jgi:hypothetical protein
MSTHTNAHAALAENLSPEAKIYVEHSEQLSGATARWSQYKAPHFTTVVQVVTENDVAETVSSSLVSSSNFPLDNGFQNCKLGEARSFINKIKVKYASANNISFLAYTGGHGAIAGLDKICNGIQISLTKLNSVTISEKGDTATFGGGILSKKITDTLWKAGKQTGKRNGQKSPNFNVTREYVRGYK